MNDDFENKQNILFKMIEKKIDMKKPNAGLEYGWGWVVKVGKY